MRHRHLNLVFFPYKSRSETGFWDTCQINFPFFDREQSYMESVVTFLQDVVPQVIHKYYYCYSFTNTLILSVRHV